MDQSVKFWDRIAERYSKNPIADEAAYQKKLQRTQQYFRPDMEVLELGYGTGSTAIIHAPYVKHIRAIDCSPNMIRIARSKAGEKNIDNITFEVSTIDELNMHDNSFDAVLALNLLHLLDNWEEIISRVHNVLKPGGVFVTSTACLNDSFKLLKIVASLGRFIGLMPTVKFFTSRELEECLVRSAFRIDYQWQPGKSRAVFIIAVKVE